jgi:hypothetical protein
LQQQTLSNEPVKKLSTVAVLLSLPPFMVSRNEKMEPTLTSTHHHKLNHGTGFKTSTLLTVFLTKYLHPQNYRLPELSPKNELNGKHDYF